MLRFAASRGSLRATPSSLLLKPTRTGSLSYAVDMRLSGLVPKRPIACRLLSSSPRRQQSDADHYNLLQPPEPPEEKEQPEKSLPNADTIAQYLVEQSRSSKTGHIQSWWLLNVEECLREELRALDAIPPPVNSTLFATRHIRRSLDIGVTDNYGLARLIDRHTADMPASRRRKALAGLISDLKFMRGNVWPWWLEALRLVAGAFCSMLICCQMGVLDGWDLAVTYGVVSAGFAIGGFGVLLFAAILQQVQDHFAPFRATKQLAQAYLSYTDFRTSFSDRMARSRNLMELQNVKGANELTQILDRIVSNEDHMSRATNQLRQRSLAALSDANAGTVTPDAKVEQRAAPTAKVLQTATLRDDTEEPRGVECALM